jgi:exodeoxyribonuclease VII large subunit
MPNPGGCRRPHLPREPLLSTAPPLPPGTPASLTPSSLNALARDLLEGAFPLVWVEGELSGVSRPASGHVYFTLKDARAQVRCALFRQRHLRLSFTPVDGQQVRVRGRLSLYEPRGDYQLIADHLEPAGEGALRRAFEALRGRLEAEGLFAAEVKRKLPFPPRRLGVVTSPSGAAVRDVVSVLARRFPLVEVDILPVLVQGKEAPAQIRAMLERADASGRYDALLLTRGGGSLEDLFAFNDEDLARCIARLRTPLVSAVGHEIDFSISDFVADLRAPTPSAAAELLVPDRAELEPRLESLRRRLWLDLGQLQHRLGQRLDQLEMRLRAQAPALRLQRVRARLCQAESSLQRVQQRTAAERLQGLLRLKLRLQRESPVSRLRRDRDRTVQLLLRLHGALGQGLQRQRLRSGLLGRTLSAVSPLATLGRGYSILLDVDSGAVVSRAQEARPGQVLRARLADGELRLRCE